MKVVVGILVLVFVVGLVIGLGLGRSTYLGAPVTLNSQSIKNSSNYLGRKVYTINSPENLIVLKCEKKRKVYYVPDKELWKWLNKHMYFCRMDNTLYPVSADGSLMSDSFKLKEEE